MPRINSKSKRQNKLKKKHSNDQIYYDLRFIKGINFGQDITNISHFQHADDTLIFNPDNFSSFQHTLREF